MTAEELFWAIGSADEEFLDHSERRVRRSFSWRVWAAACLCLVGVLVGTHWGELKEAVLLYQAMHMEAGCSEEFPGGIEPVLYWQGRLYRWSGLVGQSGLDWDEDGVVTGRFAVPEGFEAVGDISSVTRDAPGQDLQLQAGVPIRGTVYAHPEAPLVLYAQVDTSWLKNVCVRLVNDAYQPGLIQVEGRLYSWYGENWTNGEYTNRVEELPLGTAFLGRIESVVEDRYPTRDLEANNDDFHRHMMGREIFQDPADNTVIYVQDEQHWSGGIDYFWRVCRLWEDQPTCGPD